MMLRIALATTTTLALLATSASALVIGASDAHSAENYESTNSVYDVLRTDVLGATHWAGPGGGFAMATEFALSGISGPVTSAQLSLGGSLSDWPARWSLGGYGGNGSVTLADFNIFHTPLALFYGAGINTPTVLDVTPFVNSLINQGNAYAGFFVDWGGEGEGNFYFSNTPSNFFLNVVEAPEPRLTDLFSDRLL